MLIGPDNVPIAALSRSYRGGKISPVVVVGVSTECCRGTETVSGSRAVRYLFSDKVTLRLHHYERMNLSRDS